MQSNKCLYIISATIEENKTDIKEDKQYTLNKNKSKDVCSMPNQKFNSNSDCRFLESTESCGDIWISNNRKEGRIDDVAHISRVTSKFICLDNKEWVVKIDSKGNILSKHELGDFWGSASSTVDENGDLLIIRQHNKVMRVTSNEEEPVEVFSVDPRWSILSVYFSRSSEEIILRIYVQKWHKFLTNIARYNKNGEKLFEFEYLNPDKLIVYPLFLSVNINGDICISDNFFCHVIAFNNKGEKQYTYKGSPPHSEFSPTGICNDLRGHVLVCNCHESNPSVHLLDKNGEFLKMIVRDSEDVKEPWGLCVDDDEKLYIGKKNCTMIKVFRYLKNS